MFIGLQYFCGTTMGPEARRGRVVIGDDMTAQSRDYHGLAPFLGLHREA